MNTASQQVYKPRRNLELVLLLMALTVAIGAQMLVALAQGEPITTDYYVEGGIFAGLVLAFHVVLRLRAKYADPFILPIVVTLNGLGIAMIHRLDFTASYSGVADRQLMWTGVSIAASIILLWLLKDHRRLRQLTYISLAASVLLLFMPIVPGLGAAEYGARIWVTVGPLSFQPSEIAKITLAIFFAGYLANNRDLILLAGRKFGPVTFPRLRDLAPMFIAWIIAIGVLVVQNDLGNALMFFGLFIAVIYVATSRFSWIAIGGVFILAGAALAYQFVSHFRDRVEIWLNAFDQEIYERAFGGSHQVVQGLFGLAHGGLAGTGLGSGNPGMVALANSDMIIAAFGEELGFIGLSAMLLLYLLLFSRYMRAGLGTRDTFGKLLAVGLAVVLVLQVFVVVGGITRVIPLTGLATPFLAAGGSALLANWLIVALMLLISHSARQPVIVGPMVNATGESSSGTETRLQHSEGPGAGEIAVHRHSAHRQPDDDHTGIDHAPAEQGGTK